MAAAAQQSCSTVQCPVDKLLYCMAEALSVPHQSLCLSSSFVQNGGNSLHAYRLRQLCQNQDLHLKIADILRCRTLLDLLDCVTIIESRTNSRADRQSLHQSRVPNDASSSFASIDQATPQTFHHSVNQETSQPLTELQHLLVMESLSAPGTNMLRFRETYMSEHLDQVRAAWNAVIQVEPIFRTRLQVSDGVVRTLLEDNVSMMLWKEHVLNSKASYEIRRDQPSQETLWGHEFEVLSLECDEESRLSTIIWKFHHALVDGYSAKLIYDRFRAHFTNSFNLEKRNLPTHTALQALAFAKKQRDPANKKFWQIHSHNQNPSPLLLSSPISVGPISIRSPAQISGHFEPSMIRKASLQMNVSVPSICHTAWSLALSAFSDSNNIQMGSTLAGRDAGCVDLANAIGCFINVLPMDLTLNPAEIVCRYANRVFTELINLDAVQLSNSEDGFTRRFQSVIAMQYSMEPDWRDENPLPVSSGDFDVVSQIAINVCVWESGKVKLIFRKDIYQHQDIDNLAAYFIRALELVSTSPHDSIGSVLRKLMPPEIREKTLLLSNYHSPNSYERFGSDDLVTKFERTATTYPEAIALEAGNRRVTYQELNSLSSCTALSLAKYIRRDDVVCVHADHSCDWIISIFAILKAGAVYCPIDSMAPPAHRQTIFGLSTATVFLYGRHTQNKSVPKNCGQSLCLEDLLDDTVLSASPSYCREKSQPYKNAYVCFTSGTTGRPKGVTCTHSGLVAFHQDQRVRMFAAPGRKVAQVMSPAFDGSIHEIFSAITYGATLVLPYSVDPLAHLTLVQSAVVTPSIAMLLDPIDYPMLDTLYVVGEPLPQTVSDKWTSQKRLFNMYGPTETTCGATTGEMKFGDLVSVGKPNPSTRLYILNRLGDLTCPGVVGEVYIAGVQVASGYLGLPAETSKRFLPDTLSGREDQRMYKTGDLGRLCHDGKIQILGRLDRMIKLQGFRLDLDNIESQILAIIPGAKGAAVICKGDALMAVILPASLNIHSVPSLLLEHLPRYSVPRHIVCVDTIPRTRAGKVDYNSIPQLFDMQHHCDYPLDMFKLNHTENKVATLWRDIIGLPQNAPISTDACFHTLGGNSIVVLRQRNRIQECFDIDIPLRTLLKHRSLSDLAILIDQLKTKRGIASTPILYHKSQPLGASKLSPLEMLWWKKYKIAEKANSAFTVTHAASLNPQRIDILRLSTVLEQVIRRHDILKSRIQEVTGSEPCRVYDYDATVVQNVTDIDVYIESNRTMDLINDLPIRVLISHDMLLITASHMVCDFTALCTLLMEIKVAYQGGQLVKQVRQFASTLMWSEHFSEDAMRFWQHSLSTFGHRQFPTRQNYRGTSLMVAVPKAINQKMRKTAFLHKITIHQLALAAAALAMTNREDNVKICLGSPFLNRSSEDSAVVGNYVEALPVSIHFTTGDLHDYLSTVQQSLEESIINRSSQSMLCEDVGQGANFCLPDDPFFEAMVTYHDLAATEALAALDELTGVETLLTWTQGAKFKLMFEFRELSTQELALRVEYDAEAIGGMHGAKELADRLFRALDGFATGLTYQDLKDSIRVTKVFSELELCDVSDKYFGRKMRM